MQHKMEASRLKLKVAWAPIYCHTLPDGHRFPMNKYDLIPEQLLYEETIAAENLFEPEAVPEELILMVHDLAYWEKLKNLELTKQEERASGFPLSADLIQREKIITGGGVQAADYALENGCAMNVAGGTHHAYRDRAEGFCLLNEHAIAAKYLQNKRGLGKIMIVDLDVHQGNGTAKIFEGDDSVFTFSMHGKNNYPFKKEISDLDIELEDGTGDKYYLHVLEETLHELIESQNPEFLFFVAGVDILDTDKLGRLSISPQGCAIRDRIVLESAYRSGIPIVSSMGGGYSEDVNIIVDAHCNTFRIAQEVFFEEQ